MKISSLRAILHALNNNNIRYIIVGGVAVNIHGYQRMTQDLDLVIQLMPDNIIKALSTLEELGYKPGIPVTKQQFANPEIRTQWIETKHMEVLALISDQHPETTLDIFVTEPFNFDDEYEISDTVQLDQDLKVHIVSIQTLIDMKNHAGRDRDKDDIKHLTWILDSFNEEK
jgi:predicted nucleotidyltransferase